MLDASHETGIRKRLLGNSKFVLKQLPSLDELRQSQVAAWLWDVARARLVWANAAGVVAFEATSLFDLIDRVFDPSEPGLKALTELQSKLTLGEAQSVILEFPSLERSDGIECDCWLHELADGRMGVLAQQKKTVTASILDEAGLFEDLPVAVFAVDDVGVLVFANELARDMFDVRKIEHLSALIGQSQADKFLNRLGQIRMFSAVASYESRFGPRDARFTLRKPQNSVNVFALVAIEDVTERRQLEKRLQIPAQSPSVLAPQEKRAFEQLGQTLAAAAGKVRAEIAMPAPQVESQAVAPARVHQPAAKSAGVAVDLPGFLVEALDRSTEALAISQHGLPGYVNQKLATILGFAKTSDILRDSQFWSTLACVPFGGGVVDFTMADGHTMPLHVKRDVMPWKNGKADQFHLHLATSPQVVAQGLPAIQPVPSASIAEIKQSPPPNKPIITEEHEDDLRSILDISSDGIIMLDKQGRIASLSAGAEAMFGYRHAELVHQPLAKLFSAESAVVVKEYLAGLDGEGLASVFNDGREVSGVVKQGGTVPLFLNIGRLQKAEGEASYCAVVRDITTWKRTEHELRVAKDQAEEASRQKSDFLARVSHELRTPLNAIIGFSEIMRMGQLGEVANEKYRGYLNDIHSSGNQLLAMINDLLDLSKIESGRMELDFTSVNLPECFDQSAKLLQEQATRARVLLRKSFPENLPRVVADQRAMRQVMQNLLSNAIKYTDAGGQVIVSALVETSGALILRLKDTGIGMNKNELKQALVPFVRVEKPGRERQGTGLGLPLTKALVEANRASFKISSEPGQGTQIDITFPTTRVLAE